MSGPMLRPERRPNLLGIGASKAGTTWLASVLGAHPDIFMPPQKELNALHYNDLEARLEEYSEYFRGGEAARIRCDFSVRYLNSPNAPRAAARYTPDTKILLVARNPVDQIQSHYWHLLRQNFHQLEPVDPPPDLFAALERFPEFLLEPSRYGKYLERWLELFPRERILALRHEDLTGDRDQTLDAICDFLGVPRVDFAAAAAAVSASEGRAGVRPRGGALGRLYPILYVAVARRGLWLLKSAIGVRRTEIVNRRMRLRQLGEAVFFKPGYKKLDTDARARLWRLVEDDVDRFAALSGLNVSAWRPGV